MKKSRKNDLKKTEERLGEPLLFTPFGNNVDIAYRFIQIAEDKNKYLFKEMKKNTDINLMEKGVKNQ